jgi:hypothetical protein
MTLDQVMKVWAMDQETPTIKPVLLRKMNTWTIVLEEVWPDEVINKSSSSFTLDDRVAWVEEELKKWTTVKRTAWDMWAFNNKKDAEKFITLYHLVWAE